MLAAAAAALLPVSCWLVQADPPPQDAADSGPPACCGSVAGSSACGTAGSGSVCDAFDDRDASQTEQGWARLGEYGELAIDSACSVSAPSSLLVRYPAQPPAIPESPTGDAYLATNVEVGTTITIELDVQLSPLPLSMLDVGLCGFVAVEDAAHGMGFQFVDPGGSKAFHAYITTYVGGRREPKYLKLVPGLEDGCWHHLRLSASFALEGALGVALDDGPPATISGFDSLGPGPPDSPTFAFG